MNHIELLASIVTDRAQSLTSEDKVPSGIDALADEMQALYIVDIELFKLVSAFVERRQEVTDSLLRELEAQRAGVEREIDALEQRMARADFVDIDLAEAELTAAGNRLQAARQVAKTLDVRIRLAQSALDEARAAVAMQEYSAALSAQWDAVRQAEALLADAHAAMIEAAEAERSAFAAKKGFDPEAIFMPQLSHTAKMLGEQHSALAKWAAAHAPN